MNALCREYEIHQSQYQRNMNRLEAYLSRHWPEVTTIIGLDSVTLEQLLINYGSPQQVAQYPREAEQLIKKASRNMLSHEKIRQITDSAANTLGVPCIETEKQFLQVLAQEMMHSRTARRRAQKVLETVVEQEEQLTHMAKLIGRLTTGVLLSLHLDPRNYHCARSFLKALGMNLKEKSSGRYVGQLKLSKRGSAKARQYLYFAALRLIHSCPVAKKWYETKVNPKAKNKTVIAVMRKMSGALWHIARGEAYDPTKLFNVPGTAA
jgi:transposase